MRALLFAAACATAACAPPTAQPHRFSMPMLGHADVPPASLRAPARKPDRAPVRVASAVIPSRPRHAYGWQIDAQAGIRVASAQGIELTVPDASRESADAVGRGVVFSKLPAPNKPAPTGVTAAVDLPRLTPIREPAGLRALVGTRDKREPFAITAGWLADLGVTFVERGSLVDMASDAATVPTSGPALVAWAESHGARYAPTEMPRPGDVLVFDRAVANESADLVAIVIGRDERGVTEFVYAAGGIVRRGFVDPVHPSARRDLTGRVLNTFLRHGKQWPAKGTRYLAGELLAHVIRVR